MNSRIVKKILDSYSERYKTTDGNNAFSVALANMPTRNRQLYRKAVNYWDRLCSKRFAKSLALNPHAHCKW